MVKVKVTRSDGTIIEAEGTAEELLKLNLFGWPWTFTTTYPNVCGGGINIGGSNWYQDADGTWKQK